MAMARSERDRLVADLPLEGNLGGRGSGSDGDDDDDDHDVAPAA
ncbi:hypothetical protein ACP70R_015253 [Stipagrostis hirtigluma subsp. patula]